ncbi:hypothetical protein TIFTF001_022933 [Ficus carica]|uniref:Uncharacterized protein n=1 Tax=Ficus carica TaxID=3494 RepID=A0AA88AJH1_FICCA|nr:hypothetical protein TIFTF001_022933 [Ficus carica]
MRFASNLSPRFRSSFSSGQWWTSYVKSTGRLDRERIFDCNGGLANNLNGDSTFCELDLDLQTTHSNLRRYDDGGSRKLWDEFSSDMAKVIGATLCQWKQR